MCTIEGCDGNPVAKSLCAKHYMRLRRTGDPSKTRKRGPKQNEWRRNARKMAFAEVSDRTFARYTAALALFDAAAVDTITFIKQATRPNGSFNFSKFHIMALFAYVAAEKAARETP